MKRAIALILTLALAASLLLTPAALADTYATATVKGGWLRLRAGASYDSETISAYYTGTRVTILSGSGSWYYVSAPDGKTGYMHADFLNVTGSITGGQVTENIAAYVTSKNGLSVRLRGGPSKAYNTIASYPVGTAATILTYGSDWCKVRVGGRVGYMMTEFLTTSASSVKPSTPSAPSTPDTTSYTAYVTSKNGLGVRMRSGAGKYYSTIATYSVGTKVTVLNDGKTWSKIRVNGQTGYMMSEFLTTKAPVSSIGVRISASSVWPGETLYAEVTPSSLADQCYIEWLNDAGQRVGTGESYTVTTGDAGGKIRARATVTNVGSNVSGWATVQGNGYVSTAYQLKSVTISDTTPTVGQTLTVTLKPSGASADVDWYRDNGAYLGAGRSYTVTGGDAGFGLYAVATGTNTTEGMVASSMTSPVEAAPVVEVPPVTEPTEPAELRVESVSISDMTPSVGQRLRATVKPEDAMTIITWYRDDDKVLGYGDTYTVRDDDEGHTIYVWAEGTNGTFGSATSRITSPVEPNVTLLVPGE